MGRGGRDEVEVPLVIVRDKVREVHAVARYGVHVDDQLAVDVRRGLTLRQCFLSADANAL